MRATGRAVEIDIHDDPATERMTLYIPRKKPPQRYGIRLVHTRKERGT